MDVLEAFGRGNYRKLRCMREANFWIFFFSGYLLVCGCMVKTLTAHFFVQLIEREI